MKSLSLFTGSIICLVASYVFAPVQTNSAFAFSDHERNIASEDDIHFLFGENNEKLKAIFKEQGKKLSPDPVEILETNVQFAVPSKATKFDRDFFLDERLYQALYPNDRVNLVSKSPFRLHMELNKTLFIVSSNALTEFLTSKQLDSRPELRKLKNEPYPLLGVVAQYGTEFSQVFTEGVSVTFIYDRGEDGVLFETQAIVGVRKSTINFFGKFQYLQNKARQKVQSEVAADLHNLIEYIKGQK